MLAPLDFLLLIGTTVAGMLLRSTVWAAPLENAPYQNTNETMKFVTAGFDILAAVMLAMLVWQLTNHKIKAFVAYGVGILLPMMAAGSAMWAMGDSIYIFFVLLALYLDGGKEGKNYPVTALLSYGIAVFLNFYALFLFPLFVWRFFGKKTSGNTVLGFLFPIAGLVGHILLNQGVDSIFILFKEQALLEAARGEILLSYNLPNVYQLIGANSYIHEYGTAGRYLVLGGVLVILIMGIYKKYLPTGKNMFFAGLLLSIFVPFFMPFMDERASLLAAVLSVVYGFANLKYFFVPIVQVTLTYIAYAAYFRGGSFLPMAGVAFAQFALLIYLGCQIFVNHNKVAQKEK